VETFGRSASQNLHKSCRLKRRNKAAAIRVQRKCLTS
jgi:hypothetical protein